MLRQIMSTLGLFASVIAFLIGAALAVAMLLLRPELGPGLKDVRIARAPDQPLYETIGASEPLRRLLIARARKTEAERAASVKSSRARPSLAKSATAWPQETASRRGLSALARERAERRIARLPKRRLDLGPNQKHHTAVAEAAMLTGLSPAAIAALIDAEARKTREGEWDPRSSNTASSARGMAQFLEKTWLEEARDPTRFLHREARRRGLIDAKGAIRRQRSAQSTGLQKVARTPAKLTTQQPEDVAPQPRAPEQLQLATMGAETPGSHASDKRDAPAPAPSGAGAKPAPTASKVLSPAAIKARNLKRLLDMRFEPRVAIIAAAELAADNLVGLARSGYAPEDDEAAAKLAYLAHHEGLTGARAHLAGIVNRARAEKKLKANISRERAERLLHAHDGKPHRAYAAWLESYIAARIQPERFHTELK